MMRVFYDLSLARGQRMRRHFFTGFQIIDMQLTTDSINSHITALINQRYRVFVGFK